MNRRRFSIALIGLLGLGQLHTSGLAQTETRAAKAASQTDSVKPLDLNMASKTALMSLPGIDEASAQKIIDGRPYKVKNELVSKRILARETYNRIQTLVAGQNDIRSNPPVLGGMVGGSPSGPPPPPPPPPPSPRRPDSGTRITVAGNVQKAKLIHQVAAVHTPLAKQARIQGAVVLSAIIGKNGKVLELKVITGHPLLNPSAIDAVKQWEYSPTIINGEPVEVATQITVNFTLPK